MNPIEFVDTIYLGDRACKGILVDAWNRTIAIRVDDISRSREGKNNEWGFTSEEDIENGLIVFTEVESIQFDPSGPIPNDFINSFSVTGPITDGARPEVQLFQFELGITSCSRSGVTGEVILTMVAAGVHLEDPARPGLKIKD